MRVSSNAPALSRRGVMKGLACGLAGASLPVAAIAGIAASRLSQDAPLVERCQRWKRRREHLKAKEEQLRILSNAAHAAEPDTPAELYETIRVRGAYVASPSLESHPRESWTKSRLGCVLKSKLGGGPTDECRAHVQRLVRLIDEHAAAQKGAWAEHRRLDRQWERQLKKNDRLLTLIMSAEAQTLQGAAAQMEVLQLDDSYLETAAGGEHLDALLTNISRLIAALPAEA
ncbi:MAG: hypothetical protein ACOZAM_15795 [Pseudomonadota bacterium]